MRKMMYTNIMSLVTACSAALAEATHAFVQMDASSKLLKLDDC